MSYDLAPVKEPKKPPRVKLLVVYIRLILMEMAQRNAREIIDEQKENSST